MWSDYGFPDITFLPSGIPVQGLWMALAERDFAGGITVPVTLEQASARLSCVAFDRQLWPAATRYVDHLKLNISDLTTIPHWNKERLSQAIGENLIDPETEPMYPEFYAAWALQRYRIINLLKFAQIDYSGAILAGSEHSGTPTSPQAAIDAALVGAQKTDTIINVTIQRTTTTIWGPDHGWSNGTYCADVCQVGELRAVLPPLLKNAETRLYLQADAPDADPEHFDSYGTGLYLGMQTLVTDRDGYFIPKWTLPATPDVIRVPIEGKSRSFGFVCPQVFCCADFTKSFFFKEEFV